MSKKIYYLLLSLCLVSLTSCDNAPTSTTVPLSDNPITFSQSKNSLFGKLTYDYSKDTDVDGKQFDFVKISIVDKFNNKTILDNTYELSKKDLDIDINVERYGIFDISFNYGYNKHPNSYVVLDKITFSAKEINVGFVHATLPASMFTYLASTNSADHTFAYLFRRPTFDWEKLPSNWSTVPYSSEPINFENKTLAPIDYTTTTRDSKDFTYGRYLATVVDQMKKDLPDLRVNWYFCDVEAPNLSDYLYNLVDVDTTDTINFLSDGSLTYNIYLHQITNKEVFDNCVSVVKEEVAKGRGNVGSFKNLLPDSKQPDVLASHLISAFDNVHYYVSSFDFIRNAQFTDERMKQFYLSNLDELSFESIFEGFETKPEIYKEVQYLLKLRSSETETVNDIFTKSPKPNLLILGTSPTDEAKIPYTFEQMIDYVSNKYGQEYDIFYKEHPAYLSSEERKTFLSERNIEIYANFSTPAEFILGFCDDIYVGGYLSSTLYGAKPNQVMSLFCSEQAFNDFGVSVLKPINEKIEFVADILGNQK